MKKKYSTVLLFFSLLVAIQIIHVLFFFVLQYFNFLSYNHKSLILIYGYQVTLLIGIIIALKFWKIKLNFKKELPNQKVIILVLFLAISTFLIATVLDVIPFIKNLINGKLQLYTLSWESIKNLNYFYLFSGVILAPILEEIIYRGIIFKILKEYYSLYLSIIISSVFFSVMHSDVNGLIYYFFIGVILAYIYHCTKSLVLNIIFHFLINLMAAFFIYKEVDITDYYMYGLFFIVCLIGFVYCIFKLSKLKEAYKKIN